MNEKISNLMTEVKNRYNLDFVTLGQKEGAKFYLFGGVLRDLLLDKPWKEIDVRVVINKPQAERDAMMEKILSDAGITISTKIPFGEPFTVYRFVPPGSSSAVDIDLSVVSEHLSVSPDFTINGLYLNMETLELIDPYDSVKAINNKIIKTVLNPIEQFKNEPWMIFRAVKASCQFGFKIEENTLAGMKANSPLAKDQMNAIADKTMGGLTEWLLGNMLRGLKYDPYSFVEIWNETEVTKNMIAFVSERTGIQTVSFAIKNPFTSGEQKSFEDALNIFLSEIAKAVDPENPKVVFDKIIASFEIDKPKQFEDFVIDVSKINFV